MLLWSWACSCPLCQPEAMVGCGRDVGERSCSGQRTGHYRIGPALGLQVSLQQREPELQPKPLARPAGRRSLRGSCPWKPRLANCKITLTLGNNRISETSQRWSSIYDASETLNQTNDPLQWVFACKAVYIYMYVYTMGHVSVCNAASTKHSVEKRNRNEAALVVERGGSRGWKAVTGVGEG